MQFSVMNPKGPQAAPTGRNFRRLRRPLSDFAVIPRRPRRRHGAASAGPSGPGTRFRGVRVTRSAAAAFLLALAVSGRAQILNIEQERIRTDTTGWSGSARAAFDVSRNRESVVNLGAGAHLQFKTRSDLVLLLGDYGRVRAGGADFTNQGTVHFRYNRRLSERWTAEAFVQGQANRILGVRFRGLIGAGPRFRAVKSDRFRLYAAVLGMAESEEADPGGAVRRELRLSQYVSWTWAPSGSFRVVHTTYWQPRIDDPRDFRVSTQTDFIASVSSAVSLAVSAQAAADSRPPGGAVRDAYSVKNVLSVSLPAGRRGR
jgi:hypothetical protein